MALGLVSSLSDRLVFCPSLVGERILGGNKATSGHVSSFRSDNDNVHPSRSVPLIEEQMGSLEREPSAHLLEDEMEGELDEEIEGEGKYEYDEEDGEEGEDEEEEEDKEEDEEGEEEDVAPGLSGDDYRPFILPEIWSVNDFLSKMMTRVFNNLRPRYQIPDDVPIRMASKKKKCYSGRTLDVGFYEAVFMAGLRLPLTELHRRLADRLGVFVCQIYPNA